MHPLHTRLQEILGPAGFARGDDLVDRAGTEGASALLLPRSTAEVAASLRLCSDHRCAVVVQGGLTGLVDGARPREGEVALSLRRMADIGEVDSINRTMTLHAGVPLQRAQEAAEAQGLLLPLDLGARGSATVGGNIATNAGGNCVLRYGMMRDIVLGLEVVLADGTVLDGRRKMIKNNTGYDLKQLFIGSEGTLGVVTGAVLRLRPQPRGRSTALVSLASFDDVLSLLQHAERCVGATLSSFEIMWREFYDCVTTPPARGQAILEQGKPFYVLLETADGAPDSDELVRMLQMADEAQLLLEARVCQTREQRAAMWSLRDDVAEMSRAGAVFSYDVSLPLSSMHAYVEGVRGALTARFGAHRLYTFGHVADGNLHLCIDVCDPNAYAEVNAIVYAPLADCRGSVSAEHGIGVLKKPYLSMSRTKDELAVMRLLKRALDPYGILNPGRIFD